MSIPFRKTAIILMVSLCFLLFMAGFAHPSEQLIDGKPVITSAAEIDYPPFSLLDREGRADGFSVQLLRSALAAMGREASFRIGPWQEVRGWLETGEVEALPLVGQTPEREELFDFTFPYMSLHGAIVVRQGTDDIEDLHDLRGKQVAVMRGDNAEEFLRRENLGYSIVTTSTFEEALQELSSGLHDAVVIQRLVGLRLIQESGLTNLKIVNKPIEGFRQDFSFAVREGDRETLALLNEGLALVMADGTYHHLHATWFARYELPDRAIIIGGDHNYPPYEYLDENGEPAGHNVDLTRAIAKALNLDVVIRLGPWTEVRAALERGEIDGLQGMFYSPERDLKFDFTPAHSVNHYIAVTRLNRPEPPDTWEQFQGLTVAVQKGDLIHEHIQEQALIEQIIETGSMEEALRLVIESKADAALVSRLTALHYKERLGWQELTIGREALFSPDYCYAVAPTNGALLAHLSEGLQLVKESGEYQRIKEKWMGISDRSTPLLVLTYMAMVAIPLLLVLGAAALWNGSLRRQVNQRTRELLHSTEYQRALVTCSPVALYSIDLDGMVLTWNNSAERLFGWGEDEVIGKPLPIVPEDKQEESAFFRRSIHGGQVFSGIEVVRQKKDGSLFNGRLSLAPIKNDSGVTVGVMEAMEDVTDLLLARQNIIHLNHVLRAIRNINQLIVREQDPIQLIEKSCAVLTGSRGYRSTLLVLFNEDGAPHAWAHTGDEACTGKLDDRLKRGEIPPCCQTTAAANTPAATTPDGSLCSRCFLPPTTDCRKKHLLCARLHHQGVILGHLVATQDPDITLDEEEQQLFTELAQDLSYALHMLQKKQEFDASEQQRKSLEQQLLHAQKMESVGRLAGGIAHDYNNMLSVIIGNAELMLDTLPPDAPGHEELREIIEAADRSAEITRQLLAFARKQTVSPQIIDLNETVERSLKMLRRLIGEHIELIWRPSSHVGTIKIDPIQIDQLLTNLCVNARDAIPDTGTITIETDSRTIDEDYCVTHADYVPGDFVMLAVSDTGIGMTRDQMNNVFEPFFTTKPLGEGTGLGLSTVYGIVKQNDGFINVYSEPGEGTTFKIYLPLLATPAENDQAREPSRATLQAAGETILVVEDDPAILRLTGKLLQDLGYRPLLADSVEKALELAATAETLHLLLTDVIMPRMNGAELAASIGALRPGIKVIFMSGYTADVIAHKGVLNDDVTYIQKPFSRNGLAVTLKKALTDA
ncbi:transporter substrate-binding domain-containing protein [Desulfofustis limnaeus]|nr:transporter substrate-binding domain-containing protein [Desulfofustis limnaeus]